MGNKIPAPRLLKLTPLDSHLAGVNNKFHGGQFSWVTEDGNQQGLKSCYYYKVVLKDDSIVDSHFMHDKFDVSDSPESPLMVAMNKKVSSFSISSRPRLIEHGA
ncbi:hypothetical protein Droror1_Dr00025261 [Drosera rotundifolia]